MFNKRKFFTGQSCTSSSMCDVSSRRRRSGSPQDPVGLSKVSSLFRYALPPVNRNASRLLFHLKHFFLHNLLRALNSPSCLSLPCVQLFQLSYRHFFLVLISFALPCFSHVLFRLFSVTLYRITYSSVHSFLYKSIDKTSTFSPIFCHSKRFSSFNTMHNIFKTFFPIPMGI